MTWDQRFYCPSEGRCAEDFFALKNPTASAGFEPTNLGTKGQHATPRPPKLLFNLRLSKFTFTYLQQLMTKMHLNITLQNNHTLKSGRASRSEASEIGGDKHINRLEKYHNSNHPLLIFIINANKIHYFSTLFDKELYIFRTDLLSIITSLNTLYTATGICHASSVDCLLVRSGWKTVSLSKTRRVLYQNKVEK
jgi:hypothetical protein